MLAAGRLDKIKEILTEFRKVEVSTLVSILSVSEGTIRRDLEKLEEEGFLKRTHGGAILVEEKTPEPTVEIINSEEKNMIGYIATQLVENNEIILIGSGTTCHAFAKHLKNLRDITIVTNNVLASIELNKHKGMKVALTGGNFYNTEDSISLIGDFAWKIVDDIFVDKAFLGVSGVDLNYGFTSASTELAIMWKKMVEVAKETIILCDFTKFGKRSLTRLGPLDMADKIVTNDKVPEEYKRYFFEKGIPLYTSYELDSQVNSL